MVRNITRVINLFSILCQLIDKQGCIEFLWASFSLSELIINYQGHKELLELILCPTAWWFSRFDERTVQVITFLYIRIIVWNVAWTFVISLKIKFFVWLAWSDFLLSKFFLTVFVIYIIVYTRCNIGVFRVSNKIFCFYRAICILFQDVLNVSSALALDMFHVFLGISLLIIVFIYLNHRSKEQKEDQSIAKIESVSPKYRKAANL